MKTDKNNDALSAINSIENKHDRERLAKVLMSIAYDVSEYKSMGFSGYVVDSFVEISNSISSLYIELQKEEKEEGSGKLSNLYMPISNNITDIQYRINEAMRFIIRVFDKVSVVGSILEENDISICNFEKHF